LPKEATLVGAKVTLAVQLAPPGSTSPLVQGVAPDGVTLNGPAELILIALASVMPTDEVLVNVTVCAADVVPST
jgi:hypothetical protein